MARNRIARLAPLVIIALIATLPLRAVAGVAMAHCPMDAAPATQAPVAMPVSDATQAMHCHDMDDGDAQGSMARAHEPAPDQHTQGACSHCVDCCVGAFSLPASFRFSLPDSSPSSVIPLFQPSYAGFLPDGPERPPRSSTL
jgi:hypothetical protein